MFVRLCLICLSLCWIIQSPAIGQYNMTNPRLIGRIGQSEFAHGGAGRLLNIAFSADGKTIATVAGDTNIRFWDTADGKQVNTLSSPDGTPFISMAYSPDGQFLATGTDGDKTSIHVWKAGSLDLVGSIKLADGGKSVSLDPQGKYVVSAKGAQLIISDVQAGSPLVTKNTGNKLQLVRFSPTNARLIAVINDQHDVQLWDWASQKKVAEIPGRLGQFHDLKFSNDGNQLLICDHKQLQVVDLTDLNATGKSNAALSAKAKQVTGYPLQTVAVNTQNNWYALSDDQGHIHLQQAVNGPVKFTIDSPFTETLLQFSPDGKMLASAGAGGTVRVWRFNQKMDDAKPVVKFSGHGAMVLEAAFNADASRLATAGADGSVRIWQTQPVRQLKVLKPMAPPAGTAQWSADGNTVYTGSADGVRAWQANTGKMQWHTPLKNAEHIKLKPTPDGKQIVAASPGTGLVVLNADDGKQTAHVPTCSDKPLVPHANFAVSPAGDLLIVESADRNGMIGYAVPSGERAFTSNSVKTDRRSIRFDGKGEHFIESFVTGWRIYDAKGRPRVGRPKAANEPGYIGAALKPDFSALAFGNDRGADVWFTELPSGAPGLELNGHRGTVRGIYFSPDGRRMATCSEDCTVAIWKLD